MVAGINGASNSPKNKKKTRDYDQKTGNLAWMPAPKKETKKYTNPGDGSIPGRYPDESLSDYKKRRNQGLKDAMNQM